MRWPPGASNSMSPPPLPHTPSWMVNRRIWGGGGQRGEECKTEESTQDLQHSGQDSVQGNVITDDKEKLDFLTPLAWPRNWRVMWWACHTHYRVPLCLLHFRWAISKPSVPHTRHSFRLNNSKRQQSARRLTRIWIQLCLSSTRPWEKVFLSPYGQEHHLLGKTAINKNMTPWKALEPGTS